MLKSLISVAISICTALLVLLIVIPIINDQPIADHVQSSLARIEGAVFSSRNKTSQKIKDSVVKLPHSVDEKNALDTLDQAQKDTIFSVENIVDATNAQRVAEGVPPLKINTKLIASAKKKVEDMIARHYFEHVSPDGKSVADLGSEAQYDYIIMGENLALGGFINAEDLVSAWMNSPGHRANIVNKNYQDIGVYATKGLYEGKEVWFAVQHFGAQRSVCPAIDTSLRDSIAEQNNALKIQEAQIAVMRKVIEGPEHPSGETYQSIVAQFNDMVQQYNIALVASQQDIALYNTQVKKFNTCLALYQKEKKQ